MPARSYLFAEATDEDRRLRAQGVVLDPLTEHLFQRAGLEPGMRVLDLGSGAGNVSELAARLVGPTGSVLGIDIDESAVEAARRLVELPNVEFRVGDLRALDGIEQDFDAVVARGVLTYIADPVAALGVAAARVRPGGLVCVQEFDLDYRWTSHSTPLWDKVGTWLREQFDASGADAGLGPALYTRFREAGLPGPRVLVETYAGGGADSLAFGWANAFAATLPLLRRSGNEEAVAAASDPAALTERLNAELAEHDGIVLAPLLYGAWCRLPES